ncbi:MAG TPA: hypothetical protein VI248_05920 [Kineosporiaceae bacterium]
MSMAGIYSRYIYIPGKQPLFLLLASFILAFLFIRLSTRMIRAQVSWWPGNVSPGGLHVHHVVFGTAFALISGVGSFSPSGHGTPWREVFACLFGVGAALILDEFALILHLEDVYWSEEGRKSVDAVFLGAAIIGLIILYADPLSVKRADQRAPLWAVMLIALVNLVFVLITFLKGKLWTGFLGIVVPVLAVVGALRLARPGSPWAHRRYAADSRRLRRAQAREQRVHIRITRIRHRFGDLVGGKPDAPPPAQR